MNTEMLISLLLGKTIEGKLSWDEDIEFKNDDKACVAATNYATMLLSGKVVVSEYYNTNPIFDEKATPKYLLSVFPKKELENSKKFTCDGIKELYYAIDTSLSFDNYIDESINALNVL